ncbi:MAG: DUF4382 domain-containing protein [Candidatus Acidiferrales bacterium]
MRRVFGFWIATTQAQARFLASAIFCVAVLLSLTSTGCGNSCVTATWNFAGTVTTGNSSCSLSTANGTVNLDIGSSRAPSAPPMARNLEHIFVTLEGIEAHSDSSTDEDSANWQELAPELAQQPVQVDLMMAETSDGRPSNLIHGTVVPASVYTQLRLRVLPNHPAADDAVPKSNACGNVGFNCVVASNGEVRPLILDGATPDLNIVSEYIAGGFFRVLPDVETNLSIAFNPDSSLVLPSGQSVRVVPVFAIESSAAYDSLSQPKR